MEGKNCLLADSCRSVGSLTYFFFKSRIPSPKVSISRTKEEEADRKFVANQVHTRARLSAYAPTEHTKNIGKEEGNY